MTENILTKSEFLHAIADGKQIQVIASRSVGWQDISAHQALRILCSNGIELIRIKPADAPITLYTLVERKTISRIEVSALTEIKSDGYNLALTFQGSELIDAEVIA